MYQDFFELKHLPFSNTANTDVFYPAPHHERAIGLLRAFLNSDGGVAVLHGPVGAGKTLISRLVLDALPHDVAPVVITNTHLSSLSAFFQALLYDLSLPYEGLVEHELRLRFIDVVMRRFAEGRRTFLLIDEAQHLSLEQLEEIRLLTNLEGKSDRALQALLVGGDGLKEKLHHRDAEALRQRLAVVAELRPLDEEHTIEYLRARIAHAGGLADSIYTANALAEIVERSGGLPRRINQLCHLSLLNAWSHQSGTVDLKDVADAVVALGLDDEAPVLHAHHSGNVLEAQAASASDANLESSTSFVEVGLGFQKRGGLVGGNGEEPTVIELEAAHPPAIHAPRADRAISRMRQLYGGKS